MLLGFIKGAFTFWLMIDRAKISSLEIIIFELKNDGKKWSRIYFEIEGNIGKEGKKLQFLLHMNNDFFYQCGL